MIILGVDPGLRSVGWAVLHPLHSRSTLKSGTVQIMSSGTLSNPNQTLRDIYVHMMKVIETWKPDTLSIEEIFVNKNQATSLKLAEARAIILLSAQMNHLPIYQYHNRSVKKSVTGYGAAGKDQIISMMGFLFPTYNIQTDHEADAIALAYTHLSYVNSPLSTV